MSDQVINQSRKRAREDDDEGFMEVEQQQPISERPIAGQKRSQNNNYSQHTNRRDHKRVKRISPIDHLCQQMLPDICTLGEKFEYLGEDLELIGQGICANFFIDEETGGKFKNNVLSTLLAVSLEQPQKRHVLGLLVLKVIGMSYKVGDEIIQFFLAKLKQFTEEQDWNNLKNCLGFLAVVNSCLPQGFVVNVFENLLRLAIELKSLGGLRTADMIYFNTCALIPQLFVLTKFSDENFKQIVTILEDLPSKYNIEKNEESLVAFILPAVKKFIDNNFEDLNKFYPDYFENVTILTKDNLINVDEAAYSINYPLAVNIIDASELPKIEFKSSKDFLWSIKRTVFPIFNKINIDETVSYETVCDRRSYESLIFNDNVSDFALALEFNKFTTIKAVTTLNNFFKNNFFAEQGISINSLNEKLQNDSLYSTFKCEDMAVESILQLVLQLYPNDGFFVTDKSAYFYYVLVGVCFQEPSIAPVYGRAFRLLFDRLEDPLLDFDFKNKFLNWFTVQLRSFEFFWKWNDWTADILKNEKFFYNNKNSFVSDSIKKNLRAASEPEFVAQSLPEEYSKFLQNPNKSYDSNEDLLSFYNSLFTQPYLVVEDLVSENQQSFVLANKKLPFYESVERILDFFKNSGNTDDETTLNSLVEVLGSLESEFGNTIVNFDRFIITIMVQAVLHTGCRSISHLQTCLLSNRNNLINLYGAVSDDAHINEWIIESIQKYWSNNLSTSFLITELFYKNDLIMDKSEVINFLFNEKNGKNYILVDTLYYEFLIKLLQRSVSSGDNSLVLKSLKKLIQLTNETCELLNIERKMPLPNITELSEDANEEALKQFELLNKLKLTIGLSKTLLRKFNKSFKDDINNILSDAIVLDSKVIEYELTNFCNSF
ncbi:hypothetical protein QEN19_000221 [Hanseniaspora menglaensis]